MISTEVFRNILVCASACGLGFIILYGAKQRWRWLVDPPEWLYLFYLQSMLKVLFGQRFVLAFTYAIGACFVIAGLVGLGAVNKRQVVSGTSELDRIQDACNTCAPALAAQMQLNELLENIVLYGNVVLISILLIIGIQKRWFLLGNPPQWIKNVFEDTRVVRFLYISLTLIALISSVMLFPYISA
ncbi:MAG TPA: hypothetical protein VJ692_03195 [Nitrospiraceae bacterium]|nr:hypothetical protein [Nitrospiraceae bacterium]